MGPKIMLLAAAAALTTGAAQAATVEFRDAVARVTVVPEDRPDIKVEIVAPKAKLPLDIRASADRVVVDGGLDRIGACRGSGEKVRVKVRGVGRVAWQDMPEVVVRTPLDVKVESDGAVYGSVGRSNAVELRTSGCSGWTIANVAGDARVRTSGAGSVRMGEVRRLDVDLSGAGGLRAVRVREGMTAGLSGAGGVDVERLDGPLQAKVSGVGHVQIDGGRATHVRASVSGVGGVDFGGTADSLDATVSGIGSIHVREVTGPVRKSVSGIGGVKVGD